MNTVTTLKKLILLSLVSLFGLNYTMFNHNNEFNDIDDNEKYREFNENYFNNIMIEKALEEAISKHDQNNIISRLYMNHRTENAHLTRENNMIQFLKSIKNDTTPLNTYPSKKDVVLSFFKKSEEFIEAMKIIDDIESKKNNFTITTIQDRLKYNLWY